MKTTWRRIKSLHHPNRSSPQMKLKVNDNIITDSSINASKFNTHFTELTPSFDAKDGAPILSDLISEAVHQGIYPDFLKFARVTPIHKSGSKLDFKNYRPISVFPFLNKVFERALRS